MIVTQQPSTSITKLEEGIVGVDGTKSCRKSVTQPFSTISLGVDMRPGLVLQDRTIICWLNVAGDLVTAKKGKLYS